MKPLKGGLSPYPVCVGTLDDLSVMRLSFWAKAGTETREEVATAALRAIATAAGRTIVDWYVEWCGEPLDKTPVKKAKARKACPHCGGTL